jgi:ABC-2 family transporter protein
MTALSPAAARGEPVTDARVPWRRLAAVALRQHKASLGASAAFAFLVAVAMVVTGLILHGSGTDVFSAGPHSLWPLYNGTGTTLRLVLPLIPVLAGLFFGAPLVAREIETGTARFAWAQGAGRTRWLLASVVPVALIVMVIAAGLGLEYQWWVRPQGVPDWFWLRRLFALNPLPFAGWTVLGLSLGVLLGAAIRRTVPAMAATLACGLPGLYVALSWQRSYLPPLRQAAAHPTFSSGGGYGYSVPLTSRSGQGADILSTTLGWPDGRLLTATELHHPAAWFRAHHIQIWLTYQPGSRFFLYQCIEFGWLVLLSALLIGVTVLLIRRGAS